VGEDRFIFDAVRDYAETRANHSALIFGDRITSYGDLESHANRVANGFSSFDLEPQCRIALLSGNNDYFFEIWLGAALGNLVLTPINARLAPPEIAYIINDSQAEVLIVDAPFHTLVEEIAGELSAVRHILSLDTHADWTNYAEWRDEQSAAPVQLTGDPGDTMVQMYNQCDRMREINDGASCLGPGRSCPGDRTTLSHRGLRLGPLRLAKWWHSCTAA
jgi:acyl-CoA synthetase (AMP-forming)/AMP-acid ligase II